MMMSLVFAAFIANASPVESGGRADQAVVLQLSGTTMTCTKEGNHLVCLVPIDQEAAHESQQASVPAPKVPTYKPSRAPLAFPTPEALTQLKAAEANIELAKSMLPKATTPEEAVLAQQLLYRAREQYRTARAQLHTVQADLRVAPDPFDVGEHAEPMAVCQSESNVGTECDDRPAQQQGL